MQVLRLDRETRGKCGEVLSGAAALEYDAFLYGQTIGATDTEQKQMQRAAAALVKSELLTDKQRDALLMRCVDGKGLREIAAAMGCGVPTVSKHIGKARHKVAEILAAMYPRLQGGAA